VVLTNSPSISECLADAGGITHILLGGQLRRKSGGVSVPLALEIVNHFAISTAFIGVSGITDEAITVADYNEAQLNAAIIKRTQKVIVPMDRSKVGVLSLRSNQDCERVDPKLTGRGVESDASCGSLHSNKQHRRKLT
jgi:DeoR/GlpR family transcriptional regulator of sugar metabolism